MQKHNKFFYSKCPNCKQHGIKAFNKMAGMHNPTLNCIYCGKKFRMNIALAIIIKISIPVFVGAFGFFINDTIKIPLWIYCVITVILLFLFEYFAPIEEINE